MATGRKKTSLDVFLQDRVYALVQKYLQATTEKPLPVDMLKVAQLAGVSSVREIEMVPEAALRPVDDSFEIYLQKNFQHFPGVRRRQRFSLAHEVAHTFFYERRNGKLKRHKDPTGDHLEYACHKAAGMMLVPSSFLGPAMRALDDFPRARHVMELTDRFDVTPEVLIRELPNEIFESGARCLVMTRGARDVIDYGVYPLWLQVILPKPERGVAFDAWFRARGGDSQVGTAIRRAGYGTISAERASLGSKLAVYEVSVDYEIA